MPSPASTSSSLPTTICGVGTVSGYGWGSKYLWEGLATGRSAVTLTPGFGSVFEQDEIFMARVPEGGQDTDGSGRFGRAIVGCAREAIEDAVTRGWRPGNNVGLVHAFVLGEVDLWRDMYVVHQGQRTRKQYMELMPSTPMSLVMQEHGFRGPCMGVSAMCASGNAALLTAKVWLDAGIVSDLVVITTDISCNPENVLNFKQLGVARVDTGGLDTCKPFSKSSRGFNMGEASVGFVVSRQTGPAYCRVLGGAMTNDGYHVVSIAPDHEEIKRCVDEALVHADVRPDDIVYLNAHATGTKQCDDAETDLLDNVLVNAEAYGTKPMTGHCQGAAAGIELAITALAYDNGVIPAPPAAEDAHERLLDGATRMEPGPTLKTALGMGGHNAAVILDAV